MSLFKKTTTDGKEEEESVAIWHSRIEVARRKRKVHEDKWKRYKRYYKNDFSGSEESLENEENIVVDTIHSAIATMLPALYYRNPKIIVTPRSRQFIESAQVAEAVLNYEWEELNIKREMKKMIRDAFIFGVGFVELGYTSQIEQEKLDSGEVNEYVKSEEVFVKRVSPFNILIDPDTDEIENAQWYSRDVEKSVSEVLSDKRFTNTEGIKPTKELKKSYTDGISLPENEKSKVVLHWIWNKKKNTYCVIADGHSKYLIKPSPNPYEGLEGFNLEMLSFDNSPDDLYPESPIHYVEPQARETNKLRTLVLSHIKRFNRKYEVNENFVKDEQITELKSGDDGTIIKVQEEGHIKPITDAPLDVQIYEVMRAYPDDIKRSLGMSEYDVGSRQAGARTLGEVMMIQSGSKNRTDDRDSEICYTAKNIARKMLQLMRQYYDKEKIIRVVGNEGAYWIKFTNEDIKGEIDVTVEISSTLPMSQELKRKQQMDLIALVSKPEIVMKLKEEGFDVSLAALIQMTVKEYGNEYAGKIITKLSDEENTANELGVNPMQGGAMAGGGGGAPGQNQIQERELTPSEIARQTNSKPFGSMGGRVPISGEEVLSGQ